MISEAAKRKGVSATVVLREVLSASGSEGAAAVKEGEQTTSEAEQKKSAILQKFSPNTIKAILELLCDESVSTDVLF